MNGQRIVFYNNDVSYTASLFDTSAFFIRSEGNDLLNYLPFGANDKQPCLEVLMQSNNFAANFGCPKYGGSLITF